MKALKDLITDKTKVLDLSESTYVSVDEKLKVLDLASTLAHQYARLNMFYKDSTWYYYKKEDVNAGYPFSITDELLGSYLSKKLGLDSVSYQVAFNKNTYGVASINFKKDGFSYTTYKDLFKEIPFYILFSDIDSLDKEQLEILNKLLKLLSLDIYMLQKDRCNANLQFEIDKQTQYINIAKLYDFSNCDFKVGQSGLFYKSVLGNVDEIIIQKIIRKYPHFKEYISFLLEESMEKTWNEICDDYNFDKDTHSYVKVKEYYKLKDKNQKDFLNSLLKID
jgi:hypothetical protein